ncbi:Putative cytosolic protein [Staphylococcus piscifermentans]|uniref:Uncharacterized protein n=1 Tax=Staphylococcus piscifermentans TaxID=70258 RepID=A0A239U1U7_9STAP|nr:DUF309 domain-containing protein [Staphylococcus piscifermentans]RTX84623.1 DUF309 domain-containing protein [Staphylococcus piscifermentans]GEP84776.1 hypothetical protein SPI02_13610 [Staphylococcus piscifermentans]SNV04121.1 Putative cytosolic protein [Staphylococcus piscifermentans]
MEEALLSYFYQFHAKQHYFLCHDILEEAWKAQSSYSKKDAVVSLILCATGCYHYRRGNYKGAATLFKRAYRVADYQNNNMETLGVKHQAYLDLLTQLCENASQQCSFQVIELPLLATTIKKLQQCYPYYTVMTYINERPYIYDHHLLRDRHEVEQARIEALKRSKLKWQKDNNNIEGE